jgi:transposase
MTETLTMSTPERTTAHVMRLLTTGKLSIADASEQLNISERHCYRLKAAYLEEGDVAVIHGLRGKPSNFRYDTESHELVLNLARRQYTGFGPTLLSEMLEERHDIIIDSETLRRWMIAAGLWERARKGRRHRRKRPRRTAIGELVQCDGSHHDWFEGRGPRCCLFVFIDDASSRCLLRFAPSESEHAAMEVLFQYVERYGIPAAIYVDRHSVYWEENRLTQFARALQQLGIKLIYARSPQAKGRVERANRTQQDRLVKMLRLANISTIKEANAFLDAKYLADHNARFSTTEGLTDVHRNANGYDLRNIICHMEERCVNHDMTIQVRSTFYQLLPSSHTLPIPRQRVVVRHWLDGSMHVFWREQELDMRACEERPRASPRVVNPPDDHPWRQSPPIGKARRYTIGQLCRKNP